VALMAPQLKDRLEGRLDFRGRFRGVETGNGAKNLRAALRGSGDAAISRGAIKNFNLLTHVFSRCTGASTGSKASDTLPPTLAELAQRADTPFDTLKARLVIEQERLRVDNLVLATADYMLTGDGTVGFDRTARWSGSVTLSPAITQQLQREYSALRYFVDRRGRLSFSFQVHGKLPSVKIRYENRALAQILRLTAMPRSKTPAASGSKPVTRDRENQPRG
jgi:hypothetical protein